MAPEDGLPLTTHNILTTHGTISVIDTENAATDPSKPVLLLLHGNSASSRLWEPLMRLSVKSPALSAYRVLALDLPGHGNSSDAPDPAASYTMPAYADCAVQVLDQLGVTDVIVAGSSLGGHNAIEMVPRLAPKGRLKGYLICGTPPALGREQTNKGFKGHEEHDPHMDLAATEEWSESDLDTFPYEATRGKREPWIRETAKRTDGRARRVMWEAFDGKRGVDQVAVVEEYDVPCAVVNGGDEPYVNLDYLDGLKYKNLWEGKCHRLPGLGHCPFWEEPETFLPYWERFVKDCSSGGSI